MDLVVRRQSEQLNRRHFSESMDDDDNDKPNSRKFREIYEYRRWEWGNLRVRTDLHNLQFCVSDSCVAFHFRRNAKIWALKNFIERTYRDYNGVTCLCFL